MAEKQNIIISISSDIGFELAKDWIKKGELVAGTYKTESQDTKLLANMGAKLIHCDLSKEDSIDRALKNFDFNEYWSTLTFATGSLSPIGKFETVNIKSWSESIDVNFKNQLYILHKLLPFKDHESSVLFFAGGGTNSATERFSAYTVSKIALIKMVELLDAEIPSVSFSILGPGWVDTKIHETTIHAKDKAGEDYARTLSMLENQGDKCYPMSKVIECCNWIHSSPRDLVSGRNFSAVYDPWESNKISEIINFKDVFKLRRNGNDFFSKDEK